MIFTIFRFILAFCIACTVSILLIQQDPWFLQYIQQQINDTMSEMYQCRFTAQLAHCNVLSGSVMCIHAQACDRDGPSWSWRAEKIVLQWSWLDLLFAKKCSISTTFINMSIDSHVTYVQNSLSLAIVPHLLLLLAPTSMDIPFTFDKCLFKKIFLHLREKSSHIALQAGIDLEATVIQNGTWLSILFGRGSCYWAEKECLGMAEGAAHVFIPFDLVKDALHGSARMRALAHINDTAVGLKMQLTMKKNQLYLTIQDTEEQYQLKGIIHQGDINGELSWHEGTEKKQVFWRYNALQQIVEITVLPEGIPASLSSVCSHLSGVISQNHVALKAYAPQRFIELVVNTRPRLHICSMSYREAGVEIINAQGDVTGFKGAISWPIIQNILKQANIHAVGEGKLHYSGHVNQNGLVIDVEMHDACVRLANTYTIMQGFRGSVYVDVMHKKVELRNGMLDLHKGMVTCSKATVAWDHAQGRLSLVHVPLMFNKCFIGLKKQLFAHVSGCMIANYNAGLPSLVQGFLMVDQAHVRGNILSTEFQQDFWEAFMPRSSSKQSNATDLDCQLDISCITKRTIEVKTPFLDGTLIGNVHVKGALASPLINGQLHFMRGTLHFPYRPLFIQKGAINIRSQAPDDPVIELLARNRIKQYDVELAVTGSALNPSINFNASPSLEQAQIITLLLGGSDDGSLYFLMPKMMTEALESLLFGSSETTMRVQKYMQSLFHPIKKVNIIPRLSDQAGRGGVRGSLELEVNERLRCIIENNMSLSEDVVIEVAYDVSDDLTMRAKRDERGDLGIEGEMHWKF